MAEVIYSSETAPAPRGGKNLPARRVNNVGGGRAPRTEYVYVQPKGTNRTPGYSVRYTGGQRAPVKGIPQWMQRREIILVAWFGVMVIVSLDEWKAYGILPRPMRLWYTSLLYFILAALATIDILAPLAALLAVAFFFTVLYQFLSATGQFASGKSALPTAAASAAVDSGLASIIGAAETVGNSVNAGWNSIINGAITVGQSTGNGVTRVFGPGQKTASNG